jgi:hypothetical protein
MSLLQKGLRFNLFRQPSALNKHSKPKAMKQSQNLRKYANLQKPNRLHLW